MWAFEILASVAIVYLLIPVLIIGLVFGAIWLLNWIIR